MDRPGTPERSDSKEPVRPAGCAETDSARDEAIVRSRLLQAGYGKSGEVYQAFDRLLARLAAEETRRQALEAVLELARPFGWKSGSDAFCGDTHCRQCRLTRAIAAADGNTTVPPEAKPTPSGSGLGGGTETETQP